MVLLIVCSQIIFYVILLTDITVEFNMKTYEQDR